MKYNKKIAFFMSIGLFHAVSTLQAGLVQFDVQAEKYPGKDGTAVLKAVLETRRQALVYIGAGEDTNFKNTMRLVQQVEREYPEISFVKIDSNEYPSFNVVDEKQQIRFYTSGALIRTITKVDSIAELRTLLKKYFR